MVSIYDIKPAFQCLLQPVLNGMIRARVTPNQITWAALLLSVLGGLLLWMVTQPRVLLALPVILFVRMALNALDGMLARTQNLSTPMGEVLNELGDVLADIALYAPLALYAESAGGMFAIIIFVMLAVLSEFCGVLGKSISGRRPYNGPMGKSDRAFVIGFYALCLYVWPEFTSHYTIAGFALLSGLLIITCLNRIRDTLGEL